MSNVGNLVFPTITFKLTEADRISAIERSENVGKGGDGAALVFDALQGAFIDVGGNPSDETLGVVVTETVDTTPIVPLSATVDYSTGVVVVTASEYFHKTLDLLTYDITKILISNDVAGGTSGAAYVSSAPTVVGDLNLATRLGNVFTPSSCDNNALFNDIKTMCEANRSPGVGTFTPATCIESDNTPISVNGTGLAASEHACVGTSLTAVSKFELTFTLSEEQRSRAITISGTPGGDGTGNTFVAATCQVTAGGGVNSECAAANADSGTCLGKSKGSCSVATGGTNAACANATDAASCTAATASGNGGVSPANDCEFTPTPSEVCEFSAKSCDNGGDDTSQETCEGAGAVLIFAAGAIIDVANNRNDQAFALPLAETADTVRPGVVGAHVDFGTSMLTITFDEVVDLSPLSSTVNLANAYLSQVNDGSVTTLPQAVRLTSVGDNTFYNGTVVNYTHEERAQAQDGFTYALHLSEPQRIAIMRIK